MVAATSNIHCLGSLPLAGLSAEKCIEATHATKRLTENPFAVNIFVHSIPEIKDALKTDYAKTKAFVEQLAQQHNLEVHIPNIDELKINSYHE